MARSDWNDALSSKDSLAADTRIASNAPDPRVWLEAMPQAKNCHCGPHPLLKNTKLLKIVAQNLERRDKPVATVDAFEVWKPDKVFLGIDVTSSMSERPLSGMSQLNADLSGKKESTFNSMSVDSRSKLEQLKDVLATFVTSLDDVASCSPRIFGLSVDPVTHEAYLDPNKKPCEQTGSLFGQTNEKFSRRQVVEMIKKLESKGPSTAVAYAIDQCRQDAEKSGSKKPLLVLWTDGCETCGGDICKEIEKFADEFKEGRIVVFGLDPTVKDQFDCVGLKALGDRFKYVDAREPHKSLEVLGKMSTNKTQADLFNADVHGKMIQDELKGKALPWRPGDNNNAPNDDEIFGDVYGELLRRRTK